MRTPRPQSVQTRPSLSDLPAKISATPSSTTTPVVVPPPMSAYPMFTARNPTTGATPTHSVTPSSNSRSLPAVTVTAQPTASLPNRTASHVPVGSVGIWPRFDPVTQRSTFGTAGFGVAPPPPSGATSLSRTAQSLTTAPFVSLAPFASSPSTSHTTRPAQSSTATGPPGSINAYLSLRRLVRGALRNVGTSVSGENTVSV